MNKIAEKLLKNHVEKPVELSQTEVTVQKKILVADLFCLVGDIGFEPITSTTSMWRSSQMS
jgi:hypothetical protein